MQAFSVHLSILYTAKVYIFRFDCKLKPHEIDRVRAFFFECLCAFQFVSLKVVRLNDS